MTVIEYYISTYPARAIFILAISFVAVTVVIRRIINNDVSDLQGHFRKGDRLD